MSIFRDKLQVGNVFKDEKNRYYMYLGHYVGKLKYKGLDAGYLYFEVTRFMGINNVKAIYDTAVYDLRRMSCIPESIKYLKNPKDFVSYECRMPVGRIIITDVQKPFNILNFIGEE